MSITVTVPADNYIALTAAAEMLTSVADSLKPSKYEGAGISGSPYTGGFQPPCDVEIPTTPKLVIADDIVEIPAPPTTAPPTTAPPGVELDAEGLPWDKRIFGATKAKNADGKWRLKRNTALELIAQVKEELKKTMQLPTPVANETEQTPESVFGLDTPCVDLEHPPALQMPPNETAPVITFQEFIAKLTTRQMDKPEFIDILDATLVKHGLPNWSALMNRPEFIPTLDAELDELWNTL